MLLWVRRASGVGLLTRVCPRWHPRAQHLNRAVAPRSPMAPLHRWDTAVSHCWWKARGEPGKGRGLGARAAGPLPSGLLKPL